MRRHSILATAENNSHFHFSIKLWIVKPTDIFLIVSLQDHRPECPMCKTSLQADGTSNWGVNEFIEQSIKRLFPLDLLERQNGFEEDQMNEANVPSEDRSI